MEKLFFHFFFQRNCEPKPPRDGGRKEAIAKPHSSETVILSEAKNPGRLLKNVIRWPGRTSSKIMLASSPPLKKGTLGGFQAVIKSPLTPL
jgi:hypothetical protein